MSSPELADVSNRSEKKLHWTQRVALVQHNLHMAALSRDFTFFKILQAQCLIKGTDHAATLTEISNQGDDEVAETITLNMDKFNAVIACVYEDAFKNVYSSAKACIGDRQSGHSIRRAVIHSDLVHQRQMADESIDKMFSLAIDMIQQQPAASQDVAAAVLIRGATFSADAMEVCLVQMDALDNCIGEPSRLEDSLSTVQSAVGSAVSAMKGVFSLMASPDRDNIKEHCNREPNRERSQSVDGYARQMLRRMSHALSGAPLPSPVSSRNSSSSSWTSAFSRQNSANSLATKQHNQPSDLNASQTPHKASHSGNVGNSLSPIPSTPSAVSETLRNPFDVTSAIPNAFESSNATSPDSNMKFVSPSPSPGRRSSASSSSSSSIAPNEGPILAQMSQDSNFETSNDSSSSSNNAGSLSSTAAANPPRTPTKIPSLYNNQAAASANKTSSQPPPPPPPRNRTSYPSWGRHSTSAIDSSVHSRGYETSTDGTQPPRRRSTNVLRSDAPSPPSPPKHPRNVDQLVDEIV